MKIALISLDQKWEDKSYNLQRCQLFIEQAAKQNVDLIIFPEMTLTCFSFNTKAIAEEQISSPSLKAFSELAKKNHIAIVVGLVLMSNSEKCLNTLVAFSNSGEEKARYIKIHPFSFAGENQFFDSGNQLASMDLCGFKIGFTICYDLRFPELYSALAKDCNVLINIANWPKKRVSHWRTLLQARAIENQSYMLGVNRIGTDGNGLEYAPSSMIFDSNGERLVPLTTESEVDIFKLSLDSLKEYISSFSTKQDRQIELYRAII